MIRLYVIMRIICVTSFLFRVRVRREARKYREIGISPPLWGEGSAYLYSDLVILEQGCIKCLKMLQNVYKTHR